jgi:hypothetical protein
MGGVQLELVTRGRTRVHAWAVGRGSRQTLGGAMDKVTGPTGWPWPQGALSEFEDAECAASFERSRAQLQRRLQRIFQA